MAVVSSETQIQEAQNSSSRRQDPDHDPTMSALYEVPVGDLDVPDILTKYEG
jgi:hypothetical protein